jgi:hypothetical protein
MVYRNIKREDFDETLQSLGNDPAILEHETQADHLQSKRQTPGSTQLEQTWSGLSALKESYRGSPHSWALVLALGFIGVLLALAYLITQVQEIAQRSHDGSNQASMKRELTLIQGQIDDLYGQADENFSQMMELIEVTQKSRSIPTKEIKRLASPDPDEVDLKKWRHLGVGKNKGGSFVMLHDGQQSRVFTHDEFAKPAWKITHFDHSQAILQGPGGKQVVITSP